MDRREILKLLAALPGLAWGLSLGAGRALAIGPRSKLQFAQLLYEGGNPLPRPNALKRFAWELEKRTSIEVTMDSVQLRANEKELFYHPFLYLGGDKGFTLPTENSLENLRRHLTMGGFLLIDSAVARPGGGFDQSARALVNAIFPSRPLRRLPAEHTIYKSFYLLDRVVGRLADVPFLEGIELDGRIVLLYFQNDLAGAWARDDFSQWEYAVYPGGEKQREQAIRWGINIVMYAMCLDYKSDQVHVPFILKRRQWKVED